MSQPPPAPEWAHKISWAVVTEGGDVDRSTLGVFSIPLGTTWDMLVSCVGSLDQKFSGKGYRVVSHEGGLPGDDRGAPLPVENRGFPPPPPPPQLQTKKPRPTLKLSRNHLEVPGGANQGGHRSRSPVRIPLGPISRPPSPSPKRQVTKKNSFSNIVAGNIEDDPKYQRMDAELQQLKGTVSYMGSEMDAIWMAVDEKDDQVVAMTADAESLLAAQAVSRQGATDDAQALSGDIKDIRLRQSYQFMRDFFVSHTPVRLRRVGQTVIFYFKHIKPFQAVRRTAYCARKNKSVSAALSDEEKVELNEEVITFVIDHLDDIRFHMELEGVDVNNAAWRAVLEPAFVRWLFDVDNPLRLNGNLVAHYTPSEKIIQSLEQCLNDRTVKADLRGHLLSLRNAYPLVVAAVDEAARRADVSGSRSATEESPLAPNDAPSEWPTPSLAARIVPIRRK